MSGPKPEPTTLRVLKGNPGQRALPENEPVPRPIEAPKPIFGVDRRASLYWDKTLPILRGMGLGTEADGGLLKLYCLSMSTVDNASAHLSNTKWVYETCNGSQAPAAWLKIRDSALKQAQSIAAQIGLSPADRSKINVKGSGGKKGKLAAVQDRTKRGAGSGGS